MDIHTQLKKVRSDAAECAMLSSLASDGKQEVFARMAEHLNALASEIEKTISANDAGMGERDGSVLVSPPVDNEETVVPDLAVADQQPASRPNPVVLGLMVVCLAGIVAAFFWVDNQGKQYRSLLSTSQSKNQTSPALQDETTQGIATLLSAEQAERRIWVEQMGALVARMDSLVTALENKLSNAEITGASNTAGAKETRAHRGRQR